MPRIIATFCAVDPGLQAAAGAFLVVIANEIRAHFRAKRADEERTQFRRDLARDVGSNGGDE